MRPTVIGVPTFKRPRELRLLLESIAPQISPPDLVVIVGDNEPSDLTASIVTSVLPDALTVAVPHRGLARVRNELIRQAYAAAPSFEWLVMLDDDGQARPGWFEALSTNAARFDADIAGGRVSGALPPGSSRLVRNSIFAGRLRHATGVVDRLYGAQNIALRRRLLDRIGDPWFDTRLDRTGGEDYAFIRRAQGVGARLVWVDEAEVVEPAPAHRVTTRAILSRVWTNNLVAAQVDCRLDGRWRTTRRWAREGLPLPKRLAGAAIRADGDKLARAAIAGVGWAARGAGLAGRRPAQTYGDG